MAGADAVTAFAPASVGNVGVGFDILGHAIGQFGDRVTARRSDSGGVTITRVTGLVPDLDREPRRNTAAWAVTRMREDLGQDLGIELEIDKGIPLGSGMGGSAASAVAAVVAFNRLLGDPLEAGAALEYALEGEALASGAIVHADNVVASLFGGLMLFQPGEPPMLTRIPVPAPIRCVLVHPHIAVETRSARGLLATENALETFVQQSAHLAGFVAGCYADDLELIEASLADVLIEPQRRHLIPGFDAVQTAALGQGALGCSISGSGPSVFAWCREETAHSAAAGMIDVFDGLGIATDHWVGAIPERGAAVEDEN